MPLRLLPYGRRFVVDRMTGNEGSLSLQAELFQGNITPSQNDSDALYNAALANFTGYTPVSIGAWAAAATNGILEQTTAPSCLFQVAINPVVTNQIYGYLVRDNTTGHVLWAERFTGAPLSMTNAGDNIVLIPLYSEQSQYP